MKIIASIIIVIIGGVSVFAQSRNELLIAKGNMVEKQQVEILSSKVDIETKLYKIPLNPKTLKDFVFVEGNGKISDFYICDHEVTQAEYQAIMGTNHSEFSGDNNPVECVTWYNAIEYCNKRSENEGLQCYYNIDKENKDTNNTNKCDENQWTVTINQNANGYRLPTEAEWEYVARGGNKSKGYKYSGSNNLRKVAWYYKNSDEIIHSVKQKQPNELGIYDMSGNVWEWCWDWYSLSNYPSSTKDYTGSESGMYRIDRGGSFYDNDYACTVDYCDYNDPSIQYKYLGFRVVLSAM